MIDRLLSPEVQKFIKDHQHDDPFLLSLKTKKQGDFPLKEAIEQIQAFQKAKKKLPSWIEQKNIVWPPPVSIEQSSSELTAEFKSELIKGKSLVDLTGGMGVDTRSFACRFEEVVYVETDEKLSQLAKHNFNVLGQKNIDVVNQNAEEFLQGNKRRYDVIYFDPSRRDKKQKVFKIEDCKPNLYDMIPSCREFADKILVKLSPLIDLSMLIQEFQPSDIWVVAVKNEVKEVLFLISNEKEPTTIHAIDIDSNGEYSKMEFDQEMESNATSEFSNPLKFLYEPNASVLKSGAFKLVGQRFNLKKLHQHSHLYTADEIIDQFPGRIFQMKEAIKQNKTRLKQLFPDKKVHVISRNYPQSADQIKSRYGWKDGGDQYILATTLMDGQKVLLLCDKV